MANKKTTHTEVEHKDADVAPATPQATLAAALSDLSVRVVALESKAENGPNSTEVLADSHATILDRLSLLERTLAVVKTALPQYTFPAA